MKTKKAKILQINLEVGDYEYELSLEEAKDLFEALEQFFGKEEIIRYIHRYYPTYDWVRPFYKGRPVWNETWLSCNSGDQSNSISSLGRREDSTPNFQSTAGSVLLSAKTA